MARIGRVRERRGLLERERVRDRDEPPLGRADELGERPAASRIQVREDAIAGTEAGHALADGLDDAGDVDPDAMIPRRADPDEQADEGRAWLDPVEIRPVDGGDVDPDQDLSIRRNRRIDLFDPNDLGSAVAIENGRLHASRGSNTTTAVSVGRRVA